MIPQSFLQELLARVDIVDVVGHYVPLKKAGANFLGLCPFHNEKRPSFTVSASKQFYHCFGCGAHGSAISFLIEHLGLSFPDAVNELAREQGLSVPRDESTGARTAPAADTLGMAEVLGVACDFYRRQLRGAPLAIDYLKKRGLTGAIAARFGLGYAGGDWQNLEAAFPDYQSDALVEAGLVIVSDKRDASGRARRYDRFRERIMFPIRNGRGKVIGFGGRVLEQGEPKYLNSPETPLFNKGSELYGLFEARLPIRELGYALVVEGYMDVVALAQHGFGNAVATLGTACTPTHVQKLIRNTDTVVFSFDGDAAGRRAARRALDASLPHAADNREIRFLFLPSEHDPDSFVREFGAEAFAAEVGRALPLSEFLVQEAVGGKDLSSAEGRAKALFEAKPMLGAMPANALRVQIVHALAERAGVPAAEVAALCEVDQRLARMRGVPARPVERRRVTGLERRALRNLVMFPRLALALDDIARETLAHATQHPELFAEVVTQAETLGERAEFRFLSDLLRNCENASIYEEISREILSYEENVRDLLMADSSSEDERERLSDLERLAHAEVQGSLARMRYDACCERLEALIKRRTLTPEETQEFADLSRLTTELKRELSAGAVENE